MGRSSLIRFIRTTRASLDAQATASNLSAGEPYFITDENRYAVGTSVSTYQTFAKQGEAEQAIRSAAVKVEPATADQFVMVDGATSTIKNVRWDNLKTAAAQPVRKRSALFYYGYPIGFKGMWEVNAVIDAMSKYQVYVCGAGYQSPSFEEYASTVTIIRALRARGTKVYGYVRMGPSNTDAQRKTAIDDWNVIGVDGIFLDEYGFDYAVTRAQQIDIVGYAHGKSLPVTANAWVFEEAVCNSKSELPWPSNDARYQRFVQYNPNDLPSPLRAGDAYLLENFCYDLNGVTNKFSAQERFALTTARNKALAAPLALWALTKFAESSPGVVDTTKLGSLTLDQALHYIAANAWMYDIDMLAAGGNSLGSGSQVVEVNFPGLPVGVNLNTLATFPIVNNLVTEVFSRRLSASYQLIVTNSSTAQTAVVKNDYGTTISNTPSTDVAVAGPKGDKGDTGATGQTGATGPGSLTKVETFGPGTSTWTKDPAAKVIRILMIGGGGGGGGGSVAASGTAVSGGGGGGGAGRMEAFVMADQLGTTETVVVGAGGTGGNRATSTGAGGNGGVGGNTTFAGFTAWGGGAGSSSPAGTASAGGGGGGIRSAGGSASNATAGSGAAGAANGGSGTNGSNSQVPGMGGGGGGSPASGGTGGVSGTALAMNGGGGGAGAGGGITSANVASNGGGAQRWDSQGDVAGGSGVGGTPGNTGAGQLNFMMSGGSGGGAGTSSSGGAGGAGRYGSGGGGGGAGRSSSGAGGAGGAGFIRIETYF